MVLGTTPPDASAETMTAESMKRERGGEGGRKGGRGEERGRGEGGEREGEG